MTPDATANSTTKGRIDIRFLNEIWHFYSHHKGQALNEQVPWKYVQGVFNVLGIGIEPTIMYLMQEQPSFQEFENWIHQNGQVSQTRISMFNEIVEMDPADECRPKALILSDVQLEKWKQDGYVVLKQAVSKSDCSNSVAFICNEIGADLNDRETWYKPHPLKQGIMIQLFNGPPLEKNRFSEKIRMAYEQLWDRTDLLVSHDRVSFNPPEYKSYQFPGPHLHWDVSLKRPIPFGLQGLLYLSDTDSNQGAFTVVPGFHQKIDHWLEGLPASEDPRNPELLAGFEKEPIAAEAGDFIIWDQRLPHGSSPNRSLQPRIVQYINYQPLAAGYQSEWV